MTTEYHVRIRPARPLDAEVIAALSTQLGYPSTVASIASRLDCLLRSSDHGVFVAESRRSVLGWIHVTSAIHVESDPFAEIAGLVVDESWRSRGVGAKLMVEAEVWAQRMGFAVLRVRTRTSRRDAQRFYERHGFRPTKEQLVFDKRLPSPKVDTSSDEPR